MAKMTIHEQACRGCQICVDLCPTDVITFDAETQKAKLGEVDDCIACLSCDYCCPSSALGHTEYSSVKNFYRDIEFSRRVEKFL